MAHCTAPGRAGAWRCRSPTPPGVLGRGTASHPPTTARGRTGLGPRPPRCSLPSPRRASTGTPSRLRALRACGGVALLDTDAAPALPVLRPWVSRDASKTCIAFSFTFLRPSQRASVPRSAGPPGHGQRSASPNPPRTAGPRSWWLPAGQPELSRRTRWVDHRGAQPGRRELPAFSLPTHPPPQHRAATAGVSIVHVAEKQKCIDGRGDSAYRMLVLSIRDAKGATRASQASLSRARHAPDRN